MLKTVSEYLRESAKNFPENIALVDKVHSITYREYFSQAERIAGELIDAGLFKKPIAVMMDKSVETVIAFLGIAMSGNFYTVIDTKMPESRAKKILDTFEPEIVIVDSKKGGNLSRAIGASVYVYGNMVLHQIDSNSIVQVENKIIDADLLYVLFTSGSTGIPKGVMITHRSVIDYTEWAGETFSFDSSSVFGNQAPFYFDNSVLDIYSALRCGGALHIIPQMLYAFPIRLLEYVRDNGINTIFWVPTVLSRVADVGVLDKCDVSCLRNILFAGEVMPAKQLNVWMRRLPQALFANLYGSTEITVDCTYYIVILMNAINCRKYS